MYVLGPHLKVHELFLVVLRGGERTYAVSEMMTEKEVKCESGNPKKKPKCIKTRPNIEIVVGLLRRFTR